MASTGDVNLTQQSVVANPSAGVTYTAAQPTPQIVSKQSISSSFSNLVTIPVRGTVQPEQVLVLPGVDIARQVKLTNVGLSRIYVVGLQALPPNGVPIPLFDEYNIITDQPIYVCNESYFSEGLLVVSG